MAFGRAFWFLDRFFIKKYLGNNEARYCRYKVAILQMLEKQMGLESFRRILQTVVSRAQDETRSVKTLSTKEFRHFANKVGNLERPFLKDFFPRWVGSCGCPILRRFQKPKKGLKLDGSDDNGDVPSMDVRSRVSFYWHHFLNALTGCGRMPHLFMSRLDLSMLLLRIFYILKVFCASLMPSYNGILTISCIRTLAQIALKLSGFIPFDRVYEIVKPFKDLKAMWQVRIEASRALLDLEFHLKGIDAALLLFIKYVQEEPSLRGGDDQPYKRSAVSCLRPTWIV
ncbi:transcription initiation factor TFIID subunit 2 isoform X2 [Arachis duranensis]|uniref:Transcription initiation factor TFIID subunit 2 isoform X2 n=1 Tax=Arachis duranensis TaxID=130453 RepID=A0A9C6TWS4_ARADU|nr:transcription initiation factor TFIID subunit 2 isoform X2 [Arachis duranensis]